MDDSYQEERIIVQGEREKDKSLTSGIFLQLCQRPFLSLKNTLSEVCIVILSWMSLKRENLNQIAPFYNYLRKIHFEVS